MVRSGSAPPAGAAGQLALEGPGPDGPQPSPLAFERDHPWPQLGRLDGGGREMGMPVPGGEARLQRPPLGGAGQVQQVGREPVEHRPAAVGHVESVGNGLGGPPASGVEHIVPDRCSAAGQLAEPLRTPPRQADGLRHHARLGESGRRDHAIRTTEEHGGRTPLGHRDQGHTPGGGDPADIPQQSSKSRSAPSPELEHHDRPGRCKAGGVIQARLRRRQDELGVSRPAMQTRADQRFGECDTPNSEPYTAVPSIPTLDRGRKPLRDVGPRRPAQQREWPLGDALKLRAGESAGRRQRSHHSGQEHVHLLRADDDVSPDKRTQIRGR